MSSALRSETPMDHRDAVSSRPSSAGVSSEREVLEILEDMSRVLQTGLSKYELKACMKLIQQGHSPEGVATYTSSISHLTPTGLGESRRWSRTSEQKPQPTRRTSRRRVVARDFSTCRGPLFVSIARIRIPTYTSEGLQLPARARVCKRAAVTARLRAAPRVVVLVIDGPRASRLAF
ncbi:unnamed protein product [Parajaminaea phylloscopi]